MEVRKRLSELPQIEEDPRFLKIIKDYKCKQDIANNQIRFMPKT